MIRGNRGYAWMCTKGKKKERGGLSRDKTALYPCNIKEPFERSQEEYTANEEWSLIHLTAFSLKVVKHLGKEWNWPLDESHGHPCFLWLSLVTILCDDGLICASQLYHSREQENDWWVKEQIGRRRKVSRTLPLCSKDIPWRFNICTMVCTFSYWQSHMICF